MKSRRIKYISRSRGMTSEGLNLLFCSSLIFCFQSSSCLSSSCVALSIDDPDRSPIIEVNTGHDIFPSSFLLGMTRQTFLRSKYNAESREPVSSVAMSAMNMHQNRKRWRLMVANVNCRPWLDWVGICFFLLVPQVISTLTM